MANKKIGIILAADGEKKFLQALSNVKKESALLGSEMKKLDADYKGNANSMEYLSKKQELLEKQTTSYQKKVESSKKGLANATEVSKKAADKYEELKKSLEKAQKAQEEMEKSGQSGTKEYQKQTKEVDELVKAVEKQGLECQKCEGKVTDWSKKITDAETDLKKNSKAIEENAKYLKEAENATDGCAKSIDGFGKATSITINTTKEFTESLKEGFAGGIAEKGIDLVTDAIEKGAEALKETMYDMSSATAKLTASTGLSETAAKKYQAVMRQIKGDNYGESYEDVAEAMTEVIQVMGELDDQSMLDVTESAISLRDTFGMDVNESIRAVDVMMKTMGVDAAEAFDLIAKGAQNGLNRSGELTDNLTEYGSLWGQAGFSAEEAFGIMENGLNSGAYNLDKVNDFVKEFGISLTDGRIGENISSFSKETQNLFTQWQNGEASTKDVFYSVISDLESMTSEQEALTLASNIWSSVGEDNALTVLTSLNNVNTGYKNVKGTMDQLKETRFSDLESAVGNLGAAVQEKFIAPIADVALPALTTAVNGITDIIAPAQTQVDETYQTIIDKSTELSTKMSEIETGWNESLGDAEEVGSLAKRLEELNGVEHKTTVQKREMSVIVGKLSKSIPQLKGAYDEENGSLAITNKELKDLVTNYQETAATQALMAATQDLVNQKMEQQVLKDKAEEEKEVVEARLALLQKELELNQKVQSEQMLGDYTTDYKTESLKLYKEALEDGVITLEEYEQAEKALKNGQMENRFQVLTGQISQCGDATGIFAENVVDLEEKEKKLSQTLDEADESIESCDEKMEDYAKSARELYGVTTEGAEEVADANENLKDSQEELESSTETVNEKLKDTQETAEVVRDAMQNIIESYESAVEAVKNELSGKISLSDVFDGGEDLTTEQINSNLQTWVDGLANYQENLQKVREMTDESGEAIFSDEFIQMLQEQGTDAANMLAHMVLTFESQGEYGIDQLKGINDKYSVALDITDEIAKTTAANQTAYELAMKKLGSTEVEFDGLKESIEKAEASTSENWSGITEATKAELDKVVEIAQEVGVQIPEGLAAGIESGEISPEQAISQLNGTIQGTIQGVVKIAEENGLEIPKNIQAGINAGGEQAVIALQGLLQLLQQEAVTAEEAGKEVGTSMGKGTVDAIDGQKKNAESSGKELASSGAKGAEGEKNEYEQAGEAAAKQYASGITAGKSGAISSAASMASQALSAAQTYQNSFYNVGYNISAGIASGIRAGNSLVVNAAVDVSAKALTAAKRYLRIQSPSKRFKDEVGKQISAGTAFGISSNSSLAGKAAKKMSQEVYEKASAWLAKYNKNHETSIDDEKYFWNQVILHAKKGTAGYKKAVAELGKLSSNTTITEALGDDIKDKFGVTRTKKVGSKTEKKDTETYNSEIYSAAKDNLEKYKTLHATSLEQEKNYWIAVRKQLKKGSDAWYETTKIIQDLDTNIADEKKKKKEEEVDELATVQDKLLDQYKTYYNLSAKQEMQYWDAARKQFKKGTDERIEADKKYLEAKAAYQEEKKNLDEEYKENRERIEEELSQKIEALEEERNQAVANRKQEILSSMNGFDAWDATGYTEDQLLYNMKTQVEGLKLWQTQLDELSGKNISEGLLEELKAMGPEAAANIYSLNQMTEEELEEFNKLWEEKNKIAEEQAKKDTEDMWKETDDQIKILKKKAKEELSELKQEYKKALAELNAELPDGLKSLVTQAKKIGEETVASLIKALRTTGGGVKLEIDDQGAVSITASTQNKKEKSRAIAMEAMEQPGFKNGTNNMIEDSLAWLFENNAQEYVLRKADGAIMQNMMTGDKVINPSGAENLYNFAANPDAFINAKVNTAGIVKLNRLLDFSQKSTSENNNEDILRKMDGMLSAVQLMADGMVNAMQNLKVVMDSETVVGEIREKLNTENEIAAIRRNRRSY